MNNNQGGCCVYCEKWQFVDFGTSDVRCSLRGSKLNENCIGDERDIQGGRINMD